MNKPSLALLTAVFAVATPASAQRILIAESSNDTVMEFSPVDGSLISMNVIDLGVVTNGAAVTPIELINGPNGEIWVSDQAADTVFRLSSDGQTLLGTAAGPLDNLRGIAPYGDGALLAAVGSSGGAPGASVIDLNSVGDTVTAFTSGLIINPFDTEPFQFNGVDGFLVSDATSFNLVFVSAANPGNQQVFYDGDFDVGISFPEQMHYTSSGRLFVAGFLLRDGIYEYDPLTGAEINYFNTEDLGVTGLRGVHFLTNGNILTTNSSGVWLYDVAADTISSVVSGVSARFVSVIEETDLGMNFCTGEVNSVGVVASLGAGGSINVIDNDFNLFANGLPTSTFGFFIVSTAQDFVMNPAGSSGNLCLGGNIGRYSEPGQIQSSGAAGSFFLTADLTAIPSLSLIHI